MSTRNSCVLALLSVVTDIGGEGGGGAGDDDEVEGRQVLGSIV